MRWLTCLLGISLIACGGEEEAPPPIDRSPAPAPQSLVAEAFSDGPLHESAGRDLLRQTLAQFVPFPEAVGAPHANLHALLLEGGARVAAVDVEAAFEGGLAGGPRGARYVDATRQCAVVDRRVVCATSAGALSESFAYLAFHEPRENAARVHGRVVEGVAGRLLRPLFESNWREHRLQAEGAIAQETADRGPWDYADPGALLRAVDAWLASIFAYIPDVGEIAVVSNEVAWGQHMVFSLDVLPESPLAEWLAGQPQVAPDVQSLPAGAAAFVWRASGWDWPTLLREVTGDRLERLEGEGSQHIAVGGDASEAWLAFGPDADGAAPVREALGQAHVQTILGGLFDCERVRPQGAPLCEAAGERDPVWVGAGPGLRFVRRGSAPAGDARTLREDPDARRMLPRSALAIAYIDLRHAADAARVFRPHRMPGEPGPLVISLEREGEEDLALHIRASPGSLGLLLPLLMP